MGKERPHFVAQVWLARVGEEQEDVSGDGLEEVDFVAACREAREHPRLVLGRHVQGGAVERILKTEKKPLPVLLRPGFGFRLPFPVVDTMVDVRAEDQQAVSHERHRDN